MNGFNSVGDLARFTQLRQSNAMLKSRLSTLAQEVTTGVKADVPAAVGGNLGRLAQIETRLTLLDTYGKTAGDAAAGMTALQITLGAIGEIAATRGPTLVSASTYSDEVSMAVRAAQVRQDFDGVVQMINTDVGGRFLLSGTAVTTPPLAPAEDILALARAQVAGLTDPGAIATRLDDWFGSAAADGFAATVYRGTTQPTTTGVGPETTVSHDLNALDPALVGTLKGLLMGIIATDTGQTLSAAARADLAGRAGQRLTGAADDMIAAQAGVGMRQDMIEAATTRNSAEVAALSMARTDILSVDTYETAAALTQTEASIQNLYALTARLSRLSLTDYL